MAPIQSPPYQRFVGIDVAATSVTAAWVCSTGAISRPLTIRQTPAGFAELEQQLCRDSIPPAQILVVMEATSTYWMALATYLVGKGFAVSVINPAQAHNFAKALLKRAKTDAIDAQTR